MKLNWYKLSKINKKASLTLYIKDFEFQDDFSNILSLSQKLSSLLFNVWMDDEDKGYFREFNVSVPSSYTITVDGSSDAFDTTGIISFYTSGINPSKVQSIITKMLEFLSQNDIKIGTVKEEKSKMFDSQVIRIPILSNPKGEAELERDKPPEIQMANNNAFFIFNTILKYNRDLWEDSHFDANELLQRIKYFEGEEKLQEGQYAGQSAIITKMPLNKGQGQEANTDQWKNEEGPAFGDMMSGKNAISNYDEQKVRSKLDGLKKVCEWAIKNGYKELYVA